MLVLNGVSHPRSTSRSYLLRSILPAVYLRPPLATIWRISLRSSSCMVHLTFTRLRIERSFPLRLPFRPNALKQMAWLARQRPARKMWIDLGDVGDPTKKDRPEAVRSRPVLAGPIALAAPARRAGLH